MVTVGDQFSSTAQAGKTTVSSFLWLWRELFKGFVKVNSVWTRGYKFFHSCELETQGVKFERHMGVTRRGGFNKETLGMHYG